jgi:Rrf2 family protein
VLYRRSAQLAVEVVLFLALEPEGTSRRVRDLATELGVPATYLAKIVQALTRLGLLRALRGPRGGVQLARPAREIRLRDVLSAVEPVGEFERDT